MADVFISYSQEDRVWVQMLAAALEDEHLWVWWDHVLRPGEKYRDVIDRELNSAKAAIVVWSSHSVKSDWVLGEADDARQLGILLPVLMEDVRTPREFRGHQTANLSHWNGHQGDAGFRSLVNAIRTMTGHASESASHVIEGSRVQTPGNPSRTQLRTENPAAGIPSRRTEAVHPAQDSDDDIVDASEDAGDEPTYGKNPIFYILGAAVLVGVIWLGFRVLSPGTASSVTGGTAAAGPDPVIALAEKAATDAREKARQADATGDDALAQYKTAVSLAASSTQLAAASGEHWNYAGQVSNNLPQGLGEKVFDPPPPNCSAPTFEGIDKPHSAGQWDQGLMKGLGVQTNCKGYIYKGLFADGRPEGLGVSIGPDGTTYRGVFGAVTRGGAVIDHQPTVGVRTFAAPNLAREEAGTMGEKGLDGSGVVVCVNGDRWEASWSNGARNGYARKIDANDKVLQEGTFAPDAADGADPTNTRLCSP